MLWVVGCGSTPEGAGGQPAPVTRVRDGKGVVVGGGETTDFGEGILAPPCTDGWHPPRDVDAAEARASGLPIDDDLPLFGREFSNPLHWGDYSCDEFDGVPLAEVKGLSADTNVIVKAELDSIYVASGHADGDYTNPTCTDAIGYHVVVDVRTEDGRVAGRFYSNMVHNYLSGSLCGVAHPSLLNFEGTLGVSVDQSRPYLGQMAVSFCVGVERSGGLRTEVLYDEERSDSHGYGGFWPNEPPPIGCTVEPDAPPTGPSVVTLSEYRPTTVPWSFPVKVSGKALDSAGLPQLVDVDMRAEVNGSATEHPGAPLQELSLGELEEGSIVRVEVTNVGDAPQANASIEVEGCTRATGTCTGAHCVARAEYVIRPEFCASY